MSLAKAKLTELDQGFVDKKPGGQEFEVQFNPESLKMTFANAIVQPQGGDQSSGSGGRQFVGAGTTKLALQLWFDVNAMEKDRVDDVRRLTQKVIYFMTPQKSDKSPKKLAPPGVMFQFGTFIFKGMVEALEENLDFFSPTGKPLRASMSLTLSQQKILESGLEGDGKLPDRPGLVPLKSAKQNDTLQNMAGQSGKDDWQSIAAGNGIEDPLRMPAGALVDLNAVAGGGPGGSLEAIGGLGGSTAGAGGSVSSIGGGSIGSSGLNASLGGSAGGLLAIG